MSNRLVNTEDAANALNVHPVTLRRWLKAGIVTVADRTAGGHARWDIEHLRQQVRKHQQATTESAAADNQPAETKTDATTLF